MVAKSKPRATRKDKTQDKRIAKLERQFPTVNEVVNNEASLLYNDTVSSHMYSLLPAALNDEKVEFRGYSMRNVCAQNFSTNTAVRYRSILFLYKCTADYSSAGSPTFASPVLRDILNDNTDATIANYNPDNKSRIRILSDRTNSTTTINGSYFNRVSKMYKKSIQFMPLVDKAFITRPFLLVVATNTSAANTLTISHDIDLMTRQAP